MNDSTKSQTISPYLCKNEEKIQTIKQSLEKMDTKIDLLIDINTQLKVQNERLNNLEQDQKELHTKLWYIVGGVILAIITAFMKIII